jgi:hypothetical protein
MRGGARRQNSRLRVTPIVALALAALLADAVIAEGREPLRVCRRLPLLRGWSHDEENITLFP